MSSSNGYFYFVIFTYNYSKYTWLYPIKRKNDIAVIFLQFQAMIECQFNTKIEHFQSNGGGEYRALSMPFQSCGISLRLICPHTHEQNSFS